jgi:hypothetical protein
MPDIESVYPPDRNVIVVACERIRTLWTPNEEYRRDDQVPLVRPKWTPLEIHFGEFAAAST